MQSCVHSFYFFFFLPDRPTHLRESEGDGKRNILLGWPKGHVNFASHNCLFTSSVLPCEPTYLGKIEATLLAG